MIALAILGVLAACVVLDAMLDVLENITYELGGLYWDWWYGPYRRPTLYWIVIAVEIYMLTYLARELL